MGGTLFINGRFPQGSLLGENTAIYVEDGVIHAIDDGAQLRLQLTGRSYRTVDWEGAWVLPGLADSHMHLSMHGMKLSALDFSLVTSKEEMLELVRRRASELPEGEWIVGYNWNENAFATPLAPTRQELDAAAERHPVFLTRVCYHAYLANSLAFRLAGITEFTPDPPSGAYGRDGDGGLNGRVYEDAGAPFQAVIPEPDYAVKKACIRRAALDALQLGLTAVHTDDLRFIGSLDTLLRIHRELREEASSCAPTSWSITGFCRRRPRWGLRAAAATLGCGSARPKSSPTACSAAGPRCSASPTRMIPPPAASASMRRRSWPPSCRARGPQALPLRCMRSATRRRRGRWPRWPPTRSPGKRAALLGPTG